MEILRPIFLIFIFHCNGIQTTYKTNKNSAELYQEIKKNFEITLGFLRINSDNPETCNKKITLLFIITDYYNFIQKSIEELNIGLKTLENVEYTERNKLKNSLKEKIKWVKEENWKYKITTEGFYTLTKIEVNVFFNHQEIVSKLNEMTLNLINNYKKLIAKIK